MLRQLVRTIPNASGCTASIASCWASTAQHLDVHADGGQRFSARRRGAGMVAAIRTWRTAALHPHFCTLVTGGGLPGRVSEFDRRLRAV